VSIFNDVSIFNHVAGHNEGEYDYQQISDTCNQLCSLPGRHQTAKLYAFLKSILLKIMNATRSCTWLMKFVVFQYAQTRVSSLIQTTCHEKVCHMSCSMKGHKRIPPSIGKFSSRDSFF
jgi:hypothetical protein